jgi:hypothetical protein
MSEAVGEARATGTLRITPDCVLLEHPAGGLALLVWPADRVTWVAEDSAVRFTNLDGSIVTAHDGQRLHLGGGGDSVSEGGDPGDEYINRIEWVAKPSASCPSDTRWNVGHTVEISRS